MTEVLKPQYTYVRDFFTKRVATVCYTIVRTDEGDTDYAALVGLAMNRPNEQFSKKVGRMIALGRAQNINSMITLPLPNIFVKATERREDILQRIALGGAGIDRLISRMVTTYLWMEKEINREIDIPSYLGVPL